MGDLSPAPVTRRLLLLILLTAPGARAQHLVIVGGGARPASVVAEIVALGGGAAGRLVVVPQASGVAAEVGPAQAAEFTASGIPAVVALGAPDADSTVALFDRATAVFFSGGDQNRLVAALVGTRTLAAVRAVLARGGVVAGTSAGAAVMSAVMITGEERPPADPEAPFSTVEPGTVVTAEGFGFVTWAVVDQHFAARRRQNRLLSLVLERPDLVGIGVDEATAIVVGPDGHVRVVGDGSVQVFDARGVSVETRGRGFSARGVRLHVLAHGDRFAPGE